MCIEKHRDWYFRFKVTVTHLNKMYIELWKLDSEVQKQLQEIQLEVVLQSAN